MATVSKWTCLACSWKTKNESNFCNLCGLARGATKHNDLYGASSTDFEKARLMQLAELRRATTIAISIGTRLDVKAHDSNEWRTATVTGVSDDRTRFQVSYGKDATQLEWIMITEEKRIAFPGEMVNRHSRLARWIGDWYREGDPDKTFTIYGDRSHIEITGDFCGSGVVDGRRALITGDDDEGRYIGRISSDGSRIKWSHDSVWIKDLPSKEVFTIEACIEDFTTRVVLMRLPELPAKGDLSIDDLTAQVGNLILRWDRDQVRGRLSFSIIESIDEDDDEWEVQWHEIQHLSEYSCQSDDGNEDEAHGAIALTTEGKSAQPDVYIVHMSSSSRREQFLYYYQAISSGTIGPDDHSPECGCGCCGQG